MATFTKTQIAAILAASKVEVTDEAVQAWATTNGFTIVEETATATKRTATRKAGTKGMFPVVAVYNEELGLALTTTNTLYAGRDAAWVVREWQKICKTSRKSDPRFAALAYNETTQVYIADALFTKEQAEELENAHAEVIAHFVANEYDMLTRYKAQVKAKVEQLIAQNATEVEECEEEQVLGLVQTHYNNVAGATGAVGYKYNAKTGKFTKPRK